MIPLRIVEREHEDFDDPIVELWREDDFVGYVFWDEDVAVVQFYPDHAGDPFDLDLNDVQRVLDMAAQIVVPEPFAGDEELTTLADRIARAEAGDEWADEDHRVVELSNEFDSRAVHRDIDGEGFFRRDVADALIARCDSLGLAIVEMEGLDWDGRDLVPRPDLHLVIESQPGAEWEVFRPQANATAVSRLARWPARETLVIAFVVQVPDGSTRIL